MNILFIHANYPAQFKYLCQAFLSDDKNQVVYLTSRREISDNECFSGLSIHHFSLHRNPDPNIHHYLSATESTILAGQAVAREIHNLSTSGFVPDLIISHSGNGLSLFVKDLLPKVKLIGYFEWYFTAGTSRYLFEQFSLDDQLKLGMRNFSILRELELCDVAVVPTAWQKSQFPPEFSDKLVTIFDGIDNNFFFPLSQAETLELKSQDLSLQNRDTKEVFLLSPEKKIVSYATRGMEPLRGFPEFMRSLPSLLSGDSNINVVIAGADRRAYSYDSPSDGGSWKDYLLEELKGKIEFERIIFVGLLNYSDYRSLLWRSDLHCYFTRPYVTSWSFFEACACGSRLISNAIPATAQISEDESVTWVDLDQSSHSLSRAMLQALNSPIEIRGKLKEQFYLQNSLRNWQELINSII